MSDGAARRGAVDPSRSVIVQAPAGSGKTTLLVERYLGLLAVAEAPEEILAITFTRKAAAEMRQRILRFLEPGFGTDEPHEQGALQRARAVAERVAAWGLRENPQRLLIRTIDSFNHYLARTMPVASQLGPVPTPADNTQALYRRAARQVLKLAEGNDDMAEDLQRLLDWRDHRAQDIENLLAALLGKRDQWLRAIDVSGTPRREPLEAVLAAVVDHQLETTAATLAAALQGNACNPWELVELLRFAARTLLARGRESPIREFLDGDALPQPVAADLPRWRGLAELLLTGKDQVRKQVNVGQGFPPKTAEKARMQAVLDALAGDAALAEALARARRLPEPRYDDEEWAVLEALLRVLIRAAAELAVVFARAGQTDFNGLAAAALRGLGEAETGVTDLGLYLDRRIRHILVDEFQDTNWSQLHLLEKLTAGWEGEVAQSQLSLWEDPTDADPAADNGRPRTLFLVGDPMQSIYRFREAEVGLFIRSRDQGVGPLQLDDRRLTTNFRACAEIVDWVNERLGPRFPEHEDIAAGAVAYAPSEPGRAGGGAVEIQAHPSDAAEADAIARLVAEALAEQSDQDDFSAAIIVRARSHLAHILPALIGHGVPYRALQLDPLTSRPVVRDLIALTRAILQPADTAALLALLRAPFCGLTLEALWHLAGDRRAPTDREALERLAGDDRERAGRVFEALADAAEGWRRRPLRDLVEGAWLRLGGPACCIAATDGQDASAYLAALDQAENDGLLGDWNDFAERLAAQFTAGDPPGGDARLEILTMHGAKGLEWDLVVLPALNRTPGGGDAALLHWLPFIAPDGDERVLFAPLRAAEQQHNPPLVKLISDEQRARDAFETQRLLYVATTRARERLVLSACLDPDRDEIVPEAGTLLAELWPTTGDDFSAALRSATVPAPAGGADPARIDQRLRRVAAGWRPGRSERLDWRPRLPPREGTAAVEFNWAGVQARRTGTVLHRLLEQVGRTGIEQLSVAQRHGLLERVPRLLRAQGTRPDQLEETTNLVREAFLATLDSQSGRWVLSNGHRDAACERPVSGVVDGQLVNAIVDRTFIDAEGVRWIIDYKSGHHAGADLAGFMARERERYRDQLTLYRRLFEQLEGGTVRTALYLPRHGRLEVID